MKKGANFAAKVSMVVEQLENQLKLGNLEASVQGFNKSKSRPENQKAIITHLAGLQLATRKTLHSSSHIDFLYPRV